MDESAEQTAARGPARGPEVSPASEAALANEGQSRDRADASTAAMGIDELQREIEAARQEKDEQFRGWQRTQADFVNYRRRVEQERGELVKVAEAGLMLDLLPALDDLERALASLPSDLLGLTWLDGILLIERKLRIALERHGLKPIDAVGKEFDPLEHEAVIREGEPGEEATLVTGELQKGYRLHDRVLRPAMVKVGPRTNSESE